MRRIAVEVDGTAVLARLFDADAPRAAARLWALLPLEAELRQSRWSGYSTYAALAGLRDEADQRERTDVPAERPATFMCPGGLYVGAATGGIGLPYGEAQSRDFGLNTWITQVAELEGDPTKLLQTLARVRRDGPKRLRITRAS